MTLYEAYLYGFSRTLSGADLGIAPGSHQGGSNENYVDTYFTAVALGCYCAKNNVLLTKQQFSAIHAKLSGQT